MGNFIAGIKALLVMAGIVVLFIAIPVIGIAVFLCAVVGFAILFGIFYYQDTVNKKEKRVIPVEKKPVTPMTPEELAELRRQFGVKPSDKD